MINPYTFLKDYYISKKISFGLFILTIKGIKPGASSGPQSRKRDWIEARQASRYYTLCFSATLNLKARFRNRAYGKADLLQRRTIAPLAETAPCLCRPASAEATTSVGIGWSEAPASRTCAPKRYGAQAQAGRTIWKLLFSFAPRLSK